MIREDSGNCTGKICGFGFSGGRMGCVSGDGSCAVAYLLAAEESDFHDAGLVEATKQMKAVLDSIPPDTRGRQLSFVQTSMGTLLAWVDHQLEVPSNAITVRSPDYEIAKAFRLRDFERSGS